MSSEQKQAAMVQ